jgi:hypothetical protein
LRGGKPGFDFGKITLEIGPAFQLVDDGLRPGTRFGCYRGEFHGSSFRVDVVLVKMNVRGQRWNKRRVEWRMCGLKDASELKNGEIVIYLNRLSDLVWRFARWVETKAETG